MASESTGGAGARLADDALLTLAVAAGDHARDLVVVGGLTPPVLAATAPVPHHGTTDVDLLVEVGLVYDPDATNLAWLERALDAAGFSPQGGGWRWLWADAPVRLDLVCDRPGSARGVVALPGCERAAAMNLDGPRAAWCDPEPRTLTVPPALGGGSVTVRFAGLGGYLLTKAAAAATRRLAKDFYDFYFVALHNDAGGPDAAARAIARCGAVLASYRTALRFTLAVALRAERAAAVAYAAEMRATGDDTDEATLTEDAATAAHLISSALDIDLT